MKFKMFLAGLIAVQHGITGFFVGYTCGLVPAFWYAIIASIFYAGVIIKIWDDGVD